MVCVRAWGVSCQSGTGPSGLVLAETAEIAQHKHLQTKCKITLKAERLELIDSPEIEAAALRPYRRVDGGAAAYFVDFRAAGRWAAGPVEPCDDLDVFFGFSDAEIAQQCRYVWPDHRAGRALAVRVPSIAKRIREAYAGRTDQKLKTPGRYQACYALRLAMVVPSFGPAPEGWHNFTRRSKLRENAQLRDRMMALHHPNTGSRPVDDMLRAGFGADGDIMTEAQRHAARGFAGAYGEDPDVPLDELVALWTGGPSGLECRRSYKEIGS